MKINPNVYSAIVCVVFLAGNHPCGAADKRPVTKRALRSAGSIRGEEGAFLNESRDLEHVVVASDGQMNGQMNNGLGNNVVELNYVQGPEEETCTIVLRGDYCEEGGDDRPRCARADGTNLVITSWDKDFVESQGIKSGESTLSLAGLGVGKGSTEISPAKDPKKIGGPVKSKGHHNNRKLAVVTGTKKVIMVRAAPNDGATVALTEAQLSDDLFGTAAGQVSMKSQYTACSAGKLNMGPAPNRVGAAYSITNGLVTVPLPTITNTPSTNSTVFENAIATALNSNFGVTSPDQLADHVMYCLPVGAVTTGGLSYAYMNYWLSVFPNSRCNVQSAQMHELGHNFNLAHSGQNDETTGVFNEYLDQTGTMGYSYTQDDAPSMCFDAAQSGLLGWYSDKTVVLHQNLNINPSYVGNLGGIVDYQTTNDKVLLQIKSFAKADPIDYYVNFNKATGFNSGTQKGANTVTVVAQGAAGTTSRLLATLGPGESFADFMVNINVGTIGAVAQVSVVVLPGCESSSGCPTCQACNAAKQCVPMAAAPGVLEVKITTDNFPDDTSWTFSSPSDGIIAQGGTYTAPSALRVDGPFQVTPDVCGKLYTFTISDTYGDGICCSSGEGNYAASWNGVVFATGGDFRNSQATSFMAPGVEPPASTTPAAPTKAPTNPPTPQCTTHANCDDGIFCNGAETCSNGLCVAGTPPTCNDGLFCNGVETCSNAAGACVAGTPVTCGLSTCGGQKVCSNAQQGCVDQNVGFGLGNNGICNVAGGETCATCPGDCTSTFGGPVCGNGICEQGEDCNSCSSDCASKTSGSGRFCCAGGPGGCTMNTACTTLPKRCSTTSLVLTTSCCGDGTCQGSETHSNCPFDCPAVAVTPAPTKAPVKAPTKAPTKAPITAVTCPTCIGLTQAQCSTCKCTWSKNKCS